MTITKGFARSLGALGLSLVSLGAPAAPAAPSPMPDPPAAVPIPPAPARERAQALLARMTPREKIGQMNQLFAFQPPSHFEGALRRGELGSLLFLSDPVRINQLQRIAVEQSRLHIPLLFGFDVIHGLRTLFPVPIALAASWDPAVAEAAQAVAAREARAVGIHWTFAPMLDIARDPRWGRIVEGAGEDPFLGAAMAAAQVRGFQGPSLGAPDRIAACAKHFAGYGAAEGGRDYDAAELSESQLWNVTFPPFKAAVDAGVGSFMSAYMDLNGVPATGNPWLLKEVLRGAWGFKGFVVSDANAVNDLHTRGFAADKMDACLRATGAGVNMEMALFQNAYQENLPRALEEGRISAAELDALVLPILELKFRLGLFEHPYVDEARAAQVLQAPAHRQEALRAAERSAVLLRNEGGLLPLKAAALGRVALIGPLADSKRDWAGPWSFENRIEEGVTLLEGLRAQLPQGTRLQCEPGVQILRTLPSRMDRDPALPKAWTPAQAREAFDRALQAARRADVSILVLGEKRDMAGEDSSRSTLDLPGDQQRLLEAVTALGKPVVLVLMSARPLNLQWASTHVPAILDIWYPGSEGGTAAANLLLGKAVPGGKLPYTWPRNVGQVPIFYAHTLSHDPGYQDKRYWNEPSTPLFPFGFGLSYSTFAFSGLKVDRETIRRGESVTVSVDLRNQGPVKAEEVAQIYIHQRSGSASRPVRELKGFRRVPLAPGERTTLRFSLGPSELSHWSTASRGWVQDAAVFEVYAGADATAPLRATFTVQP